MGHKLAVLRGDGIGPEVIQEALRVLEAVSRRAGFAVEVGEGLIGGVAIDRAQHPFPKETEELVHQADSVLLGAVGGPQWADAPATPEQGLLSLRQSLGLFANIRPFEVFKGLKSLSPLRNPPTSGVIVRELLGGLYYGTPRGRQKLSNGDVEATDTARYRVSDIERVVRIGFRMAQAQGVPLVSVDKANVLETSRLWRETVTRLGQEEYPKVPVIHRYVDAAAMEMVKQPERYQVVVTENLFGDILSDLTGGLVGSLGVLGSATVSEWPHGKGLYEPIHGSAPDIVGKGISNPVGAIWSLALMLEWSWQEFDAARVVRMAVQDTLEAGVRTPDLGGTDDTKRVTEAILMRIEQGSDMVQTGKDKTF